MKQASWLQQLSTSYSISGSNYEICMKFGSNVLLLLPKSSDKTFSPSSASTEFISYTINKKHSYRRETARQLCMST